MCAYSKYTLFADASRYGTPPIKALFYEFPNDPELFAIDEQFMIGSALLVTPILRPNITTVQGWTHSRSLFPSPRSLQRQVTSLVRDPLYGGTSSRRNHCRTPHAHRLSRSRWGGSGFTFDLGRRSPFMKPQGTQLHLPAVQIYVCSFLCPQELTVLLEGRFTLMMARAYLQPRIERSESSPRVEEMAEKSGLLVRGRMCLNRSCRA